MTTYRRSCRVLSLVLLFMPALGWLFMVALVIGGVEIGSRMLAYLVMAPIGCIIAGAFLLLIVRAAGESAEVELPDVREQAPDLTAIQRESASVAGTSVRTWRPWTWQRKGG
jgi:hypothetical protein